MISGISYAMPDEAKNAIKFSQDRKPTIIKKILENFLGFISDKEDTLYAFGNVLGNNIQWYTR